MCYSFSWFFKSFIFYKIIYFLDNNSKIVWSYQNGQRKRWISFPPTLSLQCENFLQKNKNDLFNKQLSLNLFGREILIDFSEGDNEIILKDVQTSDQMQVKRIISKV